MNYWNDHWNDTHAHPPPWVPLLFIYNPLNWNTFQKICISTKISFAYCRRFAKNSLFWDFFTLSFLWSFQYSSRFDCWYNIRKYTESANFRSRLRSSSGLKWERLGKVFIGNGEKEGEWRRKTTMTWEGKGLSKDCSEGKGLSKECSGCPAGGGKNTQKEQPITGHCELVYHESAPNAFVFPAAGAEVGEGAWWCWPASLGVLEGGVPC